MAPALSNVAVSRQSDVNILALQFWNLKPRIWGRDAPSLTCSSNLRSAFIVGDVVLEAIQLCWSELSTMSITRFGSRSKPPIKAWSDFGRYAGAACICSRDNLIKYDKISVEYRISRVIDPDTSSAVTCDGIWLVMNARGTSDWIGCDAAVPWSSLHFLRVEGYTYVVDIPGPYSTFSSALKT